MISGITGQHSGPSKLEARRSRLCRPGLFVVAALLFSAPSHAYLDPGTGSILLQGLLAGIAVALGVARAYWQRIKAFFARADAGTDRVERDHDNPPREESEAKSQP